MTRSIGCLRVVYNVFRFVSPTPDSHRTRLAVLDRFKAAVTAVWPGCRVDTFGSFATGLYLPTSDLDLVIFGRWPTLPFQSLKRGSRVGKVVIQGYTNLSLSSS